MSSSDGPFYALRSEYARVLRALEGLPMSLCSARCARTSVVAHLVLDLPWASSAVQAGFPAGCRFPAARVVGSALRRRLMAVHADRLRPIFRIYSRLISVWVPSAAPHPSSSSSSLSLPATVR